MKEIIVLHDGHLIDESLVLYVFIVFVGSRNTLPLVGQDFHISLLRFLIEQRNKLLVQLLFKKNVVVRAVDNLSSIEGEDITVVFFQF